MVTFLCIENAFILLIISILHFFWAFGGRWGMAQSLPTNAEGERVLNPSLAACFVVALALLATSVYFLILPKIINFQLPNMLLQYGNWAIGLAFFARSIGDFRYVGFSKKIENTDFAILDTRYYSPLCVYLAINCGLIAFFI